MLDKKQKCLNDAENELKSRTEIIIMNAKKEAEEIIDIARSEGKSIVAQAESDSALIVKEKELWEKEKERIAKIVTFDKIIQLNVGGHKFDTTVATMTRFPNSMLGAMFSGRHTLDIDKDGYYFIDQDGTHFRHIINFLRNPEGFVNTLKGEELVELKNQAAYYLLEDQMRLIEKLPPQTFIVQHPTTASTKFELTAVQDVQGVWTLSDTSYNNYTQYVGIQPNYYSVSNTWVIKVCSCKKAYIICNGVSSETKGYYLKNFLLPINKNQSVQSTCQYHQK